ncbi:MAG: IS21 family transposase [Pirellulaceae bacterium]|jgi:transposase|nr:IS21 family transposase [Pirellulaceae bacterium]MCU0979712.1 IS21 family transposase [Pirellulaceae bacterium]
MSENLHNEIVRQFRGGSSLRAIARRLGISRYQVARVLAAHEAGRAQGVSQLPQAKSRRSSCLDDYQQTLEQLLQRYSDITAVRMHEELQKLGFPGSYGTVKRQLRRLRGCPPREFVQRFETGPGQQAQMDYSTYTIEFVGQGRRRVHLFSYLLGYSRRQYLRFVESQDFTTTIREHVRAFEYLGGVAASCLYDNMKVVVTDYDGGEPVYNTRFLAFATHYGYRPVACRPRRSCTKGKVERPFYYVEKNLLNGRTFQSLAHLNDVTAWWLKEVADVRIHRETKQRPIDRFQDEAAHLIPLPAQPYDTAEVVYRCVSAEGLVAYCQNRYSVPWRYIGLTLPVRITETEVIIYGPQIEEIARHPLFGRQESGQVRNLKEHQPSDDAEKKYEVLKQRFDELGEVAARFFAGLIERRRYGKSEAHQILALLESYHRRDLLTALERAVRYGAYSRSAIERILAVMGTPKTALERLADQEQQQLQALFEDGSVQPRSGKEYQELFDERPSETPDNEPTENRDGEPSGPAAEDSEPS